MRHGRTCRQARLHTRVCNTLLLRELAHTLPLACVDLASGALPVSYCMIFKSFDHRPRSSDLPLFGLAEIVKSKRSLGSREPGKRQHLLTIYEDIIPSSRVTYHFRALKA